MRATITGGLLAELKGKAKPYEVRDTKLSGFLVRVQPSGAVSFVAQIGRAKRVTLGRYPVCTLKQARKLALDALQAGAGGASTAEVKDLVRPSGEPATLRSFLHDTYQQWLEKNRKTGAAEAARLRSAFGSLLDTPLAQLSAWAVERWRTERLKAGRRAAAVNRDMNTLKAALHRAVEWGVLEAYPLSSVKPTKSDARPVVRFLSNGEELALRDALARRDGKRTSARASGNAWRTARGLEPREEAGPSHLTTMVLVSLNTGLRRGELFALRWADIDLQKRMLTVRGTSSKAGQTRHIPLTAEAHAALTDWKKPTIEQLDLIFPGKEGKPFHTLKTAWSAVLEDAQIAGFRWHDLRHTFASKLVQAGVDLNTVRELMGHADIKMTLRYAHLAPAHLATAIERLKPAQAESTEKRA